MDQVTRRFCRSGPRGLFDGLGFSGADVGRVHEVAWFDGVFQVAQGHVVLDQQGQGLVACRMAKVDGAGGHDAPGLSGVGWQLAFLALEPGNGFGPVPGRIRIGAGIRAGGVA